MLTHLIDSRNVSAIDSQNIFSSDWKLCLGFIFCLGFMLIASRENIIAQI